MSTPAVRQTELDGALGILPGSGLKARAVVGVSSMGPEDEPSTFSTPGDLEAIFGRGPGVAAAALVMGLYGVPVCFVKTGQTVQGGYLDAVAPVAGSISAPNNTAVSGTSDFSDNASTVLLGGDWKVVALAGGTRGTAGIVLQVFRDAGDGAGFVSFAIVALGTATNFAVGGGSGISLALSAGTIVGGDVATFTTVGPVSASAGELVTTGGGTSAVTLHAGSHPDDAYELYWEATAGGTIGVDGIKFKWSLDGGRTPSQETALGTAAFFVFPNSGGARLDFGAGTVLAGQITTAPCTEPQWNNTELASALAALKASVVAWDGVHVVGPVAPSAFDVITGAIDGDKRHYWIANARLPVGDETEADYLTSLAAAFASKSTIYGALFSGADEPTDQTKATGGRKYKRPAAFAVSAKDASVSEEVNIAQLLSPGGALNTSSIKDEKGNPKHHDELKNPGLDDARFGTLRSDEDYPGVFVNRMRIFSPAGSDYYIMPLRRVMNLGHITVKAYFKKRLSKETLVSKRTGFLLPAERVEMEAGATKALASVLLAKPKASAVKVTLSEFDNVLSTKTVTGKYRITPLAYPEFFDLEGAFENPALNLTAV